MNDRILTDAHGWWASLNHEGVLVAPSRLAEFFPPDASPLPRSHADQLRRDVVRVLDGDEGHVGALIDTVAERLLDLPDLEWSKGSGVETVWSHKALTGETIRPRRVWKGPSDLVLPLFVAADGERGSAALGVGRGRRVVARVVEWLRAKDRPLALLTNGRQWRLLHATQDAYSWCEWDASLWFIEGVPGPQVAALRILLGRTALTADAGKLPPLLAAIQASRKVQAELSAVLGERVRQAVELLIRESGPVLESIDREGPNRVSRRDLYIAANRIVMRCVVVLFAESRDLLPREHPVYDGSYSLQGLREQLDRFAGGRVDRLQLGHSAWPRVLSLFRLIHAGSAHEGLPIRRYGGSLFAPGNAVGTDPVSRAVAAFESPANTLSDAVVQRMLEMLCQSKVKVRQGHRSMWVPAPVDFSDLSSAYIGIVYEGLLDFELRRAPFDEPMVFLDVGNQPVLPFSRLDGMTNRDLAQLLEKLKKEGPDDEGDSREEEAVPDEEAADEADSSEPGEEVADVAVPAGDADHVQREMVLTWAERAVKAAGLVKYPRNDTDPVVRETFARDVRRAAASIVARIILPGEWFLVRWGGTRKGAGTFYTPPELAGAIVRRTLEPLCFEAEGRPKAPAEILALHACDPAMGSGSFLVAALRYLTRALYQSLHHHGCIEGHGDRSLCRIPDGRGTNSFRDETLPVPPDHDEFEDRLMAILKRHVVERCLYGVDLDPLAVELARLSLWVETMDRDFAFNFLDHKLKCGNSLVGCWFDRFQDYPVLAWEREGGDKGHDRFVHHYREEEATRGAKKGQRVRKGDVWTQAMKDRRDTVKVELRTWIEDHRPDVFEFMRDGLTVEGVHDTALAAVADMHDQMNDADTQAETYRQEFVRAVAPLKAAFDTWCALWFWPGDQLHLAPGPREFSSPNGVARDLVRHLAATHRFFHWELEFPDVFSGPDAGFDAMFGNPPWETAKPNSSEFFSNHDPMYRGYGKQEALSRQSAYFEAEPAFEDQWIRYCAHFRALSNWCGGAAMPFGDPAEEGSQRVALSRSPAENQKLHAAWRSMRVGRTSFASTDHPFRWQGSADLNTYKMFVEQAHHLTRRTGRVGVIVPSGIYSDWGCRDLRVLLRERCAWESLYVFQNERYVFEGIHHSAKMCILHAASGGTTDAVLGRFRLGPGDSPELGQIQQDVHETGRYLRIQAAAIGRLSPKSGALLEIRTPEDLSVLERMYANGVVLSEPGPEAWEIRYSREFDMTNDSRLFPPRPNWEADGYLPDEYGHWLKGSWRSWDGSGSIMERPNGVVLARDGRKAIEVSDIEDVALPLYEGRIIGSHDFSAKEWVSGKGRGAVWREVPSERKVLIPQFLMPNGRNAPSGQDGPKLVFMDVTAAINTRTFVGAVGWDTPCGHTAPTLRLPRTPDFVPALNGVLNSFACDFILRMRVGGQHLTLNYLEELAVPPRGYQAGLLSFPAACLGFCGPQFAREWLALPPAVTNHKAPWRRLWAVTIHERLRLRCILEAVVAQLYGLDPENFAWVVRDCDHPSAQICDKAFARTLDPKGFWRVEKNLAPEIRLPVLAQVAFRDLKNRLAVPGANHDRVVAEFCGDPSSGSDGWQLPQELRLADYGLGHDDRATVPQPVASRLGPRFLPWQLDQDPAESWEECRRHADLIARIRGQGASVARELSNTPAPAPATQSYSGAQTDLFGNVVPVQTDLFGHVVRSPRGGRR